MPNPLGESSAAAEKRNHVGLQHRAGWVALSPVRVSLGLQPARGRSSAAAEKRNRLAGLDEIILGPLIFSPVTNSWTNWCLQGLNSPPNHNLAPDRENYRWSGTTQGIPGKPVNQCAT